jgi:hypothetical protein
MKQLRPVISYDNLTGTPQVSLDYVQNKQYEKSLEDIFQFLESQKSLIVIAIDEFQQITQYPAKNIEAILRTQIQNLHHVRFIFSGSSPHLLAAMFHHTKRPFFSSTQTIDLLEIEAEKYEDFISKMFRTNGRSITADAVNYILDFSKRHTYYTQWLCNQVFATTMVNIVEDDVRNEVVGILQQNETVYFQYRTLLTANQWHVLRAIAKEDKMRNPNSKGILKRHQLGSSSVIQRSMEALLQKEMIYMREDELGRYYCVYDCFLARWLELK